MIPTAVISGALWVGQKLLGWSEKAADAETERRKIDAGVKVETLKAHAAVIKSAHGHRVFWVVWFIAAVPMALWFGWGVLDSMFNGALPDVAELPPQLEKYADVVWVNIFYSGAGMASVQVAARTVTGWFGRRK